MSNSMGRWMGDEKGSTHFQKVIISFVLRWDTIALPLVTTYHIHI